VTEPVDPSIAEEWSKAARAGAGRKRRLMIPVIVGCALFVSVTLGIFLGVGAWTGERAAARKQSLADRGLVEVTTRRGRTVSEGELTRDAGAGLFFLAVAVGALAGVGGFVATGGKISAEHARGLGQKR
jgi:hypothetical protein